MVHSSNEHPAEPPLARVRALCAAIYGESQAEQAFAQLSRTIAAYPPIPPRFGSDLTERDALLITYGDQVRAPDQPPLRTLAEFCAKRLAGVVSTIHVLPFYPYTSDDGFAVADHRAVNSDLGSWDDIAQLGKRFRLMFDAVVNHVSARHPWFRAYLRGDSPYVDYFIAVEGDPDLSQVVRPRTSPLLTEVETAQGRRKVWTTFSDDQIDLNYANPAVLTEMVDLLLFYAQHEADFIRLDAIAYLWKQIGTPCVHLPNTHRVVQLFRAALDAIAPHVRLITETNVPHAENVSYFGNGYNEAQLVYNFALPPLVLYALQTGDARTLSQWAGSLALPSRRVTFLNFLASHDGIGLNPVRGILSEREIAGLVERTRALGGLVSEKFNSDGSRSPYELNVNYLDALCFAPADEATCVQRFIAAHAIMLALVGVPAVYFHSLFGSRGWPAGVRQLGYNRAINREKLSRAALERELSDGQARRAQVFNSLAHLLRARAGCPAFHPFGDQRVLDAGPAIFALLRSAPDDRSRLLCLVNVSAQPELVHLPWRALLGTNNAVRDLISGARLSVHGPSLELAPYETRWLANA